MLQFLETYGLPPALVIVGGFVLLRAADALVDRAAHLARSYRVPPEIVGAVVLGFGTSVPELLISVTAVLAKDTSPAVAMGNVVGSNIANVGLILGFAAFMAPFRVDRYLLRVDLPLGVAVGLLLLLWIGPAREVNSVHAVALLAIFSGYILLSVRRAKAHRRATYGEETPTPTPAKDVAWVVGCLLLVAVGARVFVWGATLTAELFSVPQEFIGLSIVAVGTSLPELTTVYAAAKRGHAELAAGNVAGSNLFNVLFVLGVTALIADIPFSRAMAVHDLTAMTVFALAAFPLMWKTRTLGRVQGGLLVAGYLTYIVLAFGDARIGP